MMVSKSERQAPAVSDAQFRVVSEREAAVRLALGRRTLQDLRLKGGGPAYIQLGRRRVGYAVADLEAWAAARRITNTAMLPVRL